MARERKKMGRPGIFFHIVEREFGKFFSNSVAVAIFIGAPLLYGVVFGSLYTDGQVYDIPVAVVDASRGAIGERIVDGLRDHENIAVAGVFACEQGLWDSFVRGDVHAIITLGPGFDTDVLMGRMPEVHVRLNTANLLVTNYVSGAVQHVLATEETTIRTGAMIRSGTLPAPTAKDHHSAFSVHYSRYFNPSGNYLFFLLPGFLGMVLQQVFMLVTALSFARETEEKTFDELTGKTRSAVMIVFGKSFPYWIMGMLMWLFSLHGILYWYGVPMDGSPAALYGLSLLFVLSMASIGILVSAAVPSQLKATEILMVMAAPAFLLSGYTWPLSQMPQAVAAVAKLIPTTHFLEALRKIILADASMLHLLPETVFLALLAVIPFAATILIVKRNMRA